MKKGHLFLLAIFIPTLAWALGSWQFYNRVWYNTQTGQTLNLSPATYPPGVATFTPMPTMIITPNPTDSFVAIPTPYPPYQIPMGFYPFNTLLNSGLFLDDYGNLWLPRGTPPNQGVAGIASVGDIQMIGEARGGNESGIIATASQIDFIVPGGARPFWDGNTGGLAYQSAPAEALSYEWFKSSAGFTGFVTMGSSGAATVISANLVSSNFYGVTIVGEAHLISLNGGTAGSMAVSNAGTTLFFSGLSTDRGIYWWEAVGLD